MQHTRRLEFTRPARAVPNQARNAAEAVMYLAHVTRERRRLEQERVSLERRIRRITARLVAIASIETRLVPMIQPAPPRPPAAAPRQAPSARQPSQTGGGEVTLQY
jgi:hypothetical protein